MRLSTMMVLISAASGACAMFGLWSFYHSFAPIPSQLKTFAGKAVEVRTATIRYTRSYATFQLKQANGEVIEFSYTPLFKRFYYFAEHVKDGVNVEVTTGPGGKHDFWGLKLESLTLMTPIEAREARLTEGRWGLALFAAFLGSAVWVALQIPALRRKGF